VAAVALALARGVIALATAGAVGGALAQRAHGAHEGVAARARAVAIAASDAGTVVAAVLGTKALVALLTGPALFTHASVVVAFAVLTALAAELAAVLALELGLAAAGAVEALSILARAVVSARQLRAVVLPVLGGALTKSVVAAAVVRAVVLAQRDLAKLASEQVIALAGAIKAVTVVAAVLRQTFSSHVSPAKPGRQVQVPSSVSSLFTLVMVNTPRSEHLAEFISASQSAPS